MEPKKYTGIIVFIKGNVSLLKSADTIINSKINRAILNGNKLVIEFAATEDQTSGLIDLYSTDMIIYDGILMFKGRKKTSLAVVVTWFENSKAVLLTGKCLNESEKWTVLIHLIPVVTF